MGKTNRKEIVESFSASDRNWYFITNKPTMNTFFIFKIFIIKNVSEWIISFFRFEYSFFIWKTFCAFIVNRISKNLI